MNTDDELHSKATASIVALMEKTGQPLTDMQQVTLAGAIAVWITKAQPWPDAGILRMTHGALAEIERLRKMERAVKRLIGMQEELPPDFAKVLHDNLWELYESDVPNNEVRGAKERSS